MKLSTGKVAFPIEFDNGDTATFFFNPNDRALRERVTQFEASIKEKVQTLDFDKYKKAFKEGVPTVDLEHPETLLEMPLDDLKALQSGFDAIDGIEKEYNDIIKNEMDAVFGSKISDVVFRYCEPFDSVIIADKDGNEKSELYVIHFLQEFMLALKRLGDKNKSAMDKHLSKYGK